MQREQAPYFREGAQLYKGRYVEVMPVLLGDGLTPVSPSDVMQARNNAAGTQNQDSMWNIYFDTDFGLAANSKKVYLSPHSKGLRKLTPDTKLKDYGVELSSVSGAKVFKKGDLKLNTRLTEKEARSHPLWKALAGNQALLDSYVQNAFKLGKDKFNYDEMMGFYVPNDSKPVLRAVVLDGLGNGSYAGGDGNLGDDDARLVGVRSNVSSEAANAKNSSQLESRVLDALKQGACFNYGGRLYVPVDPKAVQKAK